MAMTDAKEQQRLIEQDLYNELRWMLVAATEWHICDQTVTNTGPLPNLPNHFQVLAMDSACVHIRSLYDFLIVNKTERADTAYASRDFNVTLAPTPLYKDYIDSINKRLMHIDTNRPAPRRQNGKQVKTDLNRKVLDLAQDVLSLWDDFLREVPQFSKQLTKARTDAIDDAKRAADALGGVCPFI